MRKDFRLHIESLYAQALEQVGVRKAKVTAHRDGSVTIRSNDRVAAAVARIPGVKITLRGTTEITFDIPAGLQYAEQRPALTTPEERAAAAAERETRRAKRAAEDAPEVDDLEGLEEEFGEAGAEGI